MSRKISVTPESRGTSSPLGATILPGGVNFSIFSRGAVAVDLLLFDREDDPRPTRVIPIDPVTNRVYHYWHVFVPGLQAGQLYGYRVHGPFEFELPHTGGQNQNAWHRWIDTALDSPHDIEEWETAPLIPNPTYRSRPHSLVMLFAKVRPYDG